MHPRWRKWLRLNQHRRPLGRHLNHRQHPQHHFRQILLLDRHRRQPHLHRCQKCHNHRRRHHRRPPIPPNSPPSPAPAASPIFIAAKSVIIIAAATTAATTATKATTTPV